MVNKNLDNAVGSTINQANNFVNNNFGLLTQTQEQQRASKINKLREEYEKNLSIGNNISSDIKTSYDNWHKEKYGETHLKNYYAKIAENDLKKKTVKNLQNKNEIDKQIANLQEKITKLQGTYDKLIDYKRKLIKENQILEINIDKIKGDINKNNRLFDYENSEINDILSSRYIILFLYYIIFIIYLLFGNFKNNGLYNNNKILFFIILYCFFPFIINYILYISYSESDTCRGGTKAINEETGQTVCRPSNYEKKEPDTTELNTLKKKKYNGLANALQIEIDEYNKNYRNNIKGQVWNDWSWLTENDACNERDCEIDYKWKEKADYISENLQRLNV